MRKLQPKTFVRVGQHKNRKQFKQHVSKGMSTEYISSQRDECTPHGPRGCVHLCLGQIGVYLKPAQMTGRLASQGQPTRKLG